MPFVPLATRKRLEVLLDDDRERIGTLQRQRDQHAVNRHFDFAHARSGYRFGNHAATQGPIRGPAVPFSAATSTWEPPEVSPSNAASLRASEHAVVGSHTEASHGTMRLQRSFSTPGKAGSLLEKAKNDANPLTLERRRWEKFAEFSLKGELQGKEPPPPLRRDPPPKPQPTKGLVNFPKYSLIHNCHLKQIDQFRFVRQEQEARDAMRAQEGEDDDTPAAADCDSPPGTTGTSATMGFPDATRSQMFKYSQGAAVHSGSLIMQSAPTLRGSLHTHQLPSDARFAGGALPHGRGMRTSNPFRMG